MIRARPVRVLLAVVGLAVLGTVWIGRITGATIDEDGGHTLRMALNLVHGGVMSMDTEAPLQPSMYREPLPVLVAAAAVAGVDAAWGRAESAQYFEGRRARFVKLTNVAWILLLCAGVYAAIRLFSPSRILAVAGALLVNLELPLMPSGLTGLGLDSLNSDLPAAALLVTGSALLAAGLFQSGSLRCAVAGLVFGALALVKASFLYVFMGLVVSVLLLGLVLLKRQGKGDVLARSLALVAVFAAVVAPWMLRNHAQFGSWSIAERGGVVLLIRAVKDRMTAEEYRGAFYVWAPPGVRPAVGWLLGYGPGDLQRGGRLQRLNRYPTADFHPEDVAAERAGRPDLAISYYRQARAQRQQLYNEIGTTSGSTEVDRRLQDRALRMIQDAPLRHLATTVPFLWRGAFVAFPVLAVALIAAMRRHDLRRAAFLWPSLGLILFYGLLTHFIPRYGTPIVPVVIVAVLILWARPRPARG